MGYYNCIMHITLNSGYCQRSYANEVNKESYTFLHRLFYASLMREVEIVKGYKMRSTGGEMGYLISLFNEEDGDKIPVLTVGVSKNDTDELWRILHTDPTMPLLTNIFDRPRGSYIADRLEYGSMIFTDVFAWTGIFSQCLGWICLSDVLRKEII